MDTQKIGGFLAALRKNKGLTQQGLADILNVSNKTISKWECGDAVPEITLLMTIASFYQVTVDEILKGNRKEEDPLSQSPMDALKIKPITQNEGQQREKQLKLFALISYALLLISISLVILFITSRPGLAFGLGIPLVIISGGFILAGISVARNRMEDVLDEVAQTCINILTYKVAYLYVAMIGLTLLFVLQLRTFAAVLNLIVLVIAILGTPFYYYHLKEKIFGVSISTNIKKINRLISLLRPLYLVTTVVIASYTFFTPIYEVAHYNGLLLVEQVVGSYFNVLFLRPNLVGLYIFGALYVLGVGYAIYAYIQKKTIAYSYLFQAVSVLGVFLALNDQFLIDYRDFSTRYDSVNSSFYSLVPLIYTLSILGIAHMVHRIFLWMVFKKK